MSSEVVLRLRGLEKRYIHSGERIEVLSGIDLDLRRGEGKVVMGTSGSGKSTLLHTSGLLESIDGGRIEIGGSEVRGGDMKSRALIRRKNIGFIYQSHNLLPEFTSLENVQMPLWINGVGKKESESRSRELLREVGLELRLRHYPRELSGGEQQRVAIARALVCSPLLVLADEPTGNLDVVRARQVFEVLGRMCSKLGSALLLATHNPELAKSFGSILRIEGGRLRESEV